MLSENNPANFAPPRTLDTLVGGQDPGALQRVTRDLSAGIAKNLPKDHPGLQVMKLLQQFQQRSLDAQSEQVGRIRANPPKELIGASPDLLANVRNASAQAVEPSITGPQLAAKNLQSLYNTYETSFGSQSSFTSAQRHKGAKAANISINDFEKMDESGQKFFIENDFMVANRRKQIDQEIKSGIDPSDIEGEIAGSNLPPEVKDALTKHLYSKAPRSEPGILSSIGGAIGRLFSSRQSQAQQSPQ